MKEDRKIQRLVFVRGLLVSIRIWQGSLRENNHTHGFCTKSSSSYYVIAAFENSRKLYPEIRRSHWLRGLTNNQWQASGRVEELPISQRIKYGIQPPCCFMDKRQNKPQNKIARRRANPMSLGPLKIDSFEKWPKRNITSVSFLIPQLSPEASDRCRAGRLRRCTHLLIQFS